MKMTFNRTLLLLGKILTGTFASIFLMTGCGADGNISENLNTVNDREISGIAGPPDTSQMASASRVSRGQFSTTNTAADLSFPDLNSEELSIFNQGLSLFSTARTDFTGLGPIFNQTSCLGCHDNSNAPTATPAGRAARTNQTNYTLSSQGVRPDTDAFTLFVDFSSSSGSVIPLSEFGGPIQHVGATGGCSPDIIPDVSIDPFLQGGGIGLRRAVGERAAPPYIGRGLIEAIYADDIVANRDPGDAQTHSSTLLPALATSGCPTGGDCISGRHNENSAANAIIGGDPVIRPARFGLRAAGPTLIQFMIGGSQGEVGLTSPFAPNEQNNNQNGGKKCDQAPDPELKTNDILDLRAMIRLVALPDFDSCLLETPAVTAACTSGGSASSIQNGAALFGVDLTAFRNRMTDTNLPDGLNENALNQADRQLNCAGCHTPIMRTGQSPAEVGAQHLSNKWVPLFSDLLIHDMGEVTVERVSPVLRAPTTIGSGLDISRNLADDALPGQGIANGREWRTPPLMGIGVIGPPFMHDGRVFVNPGAPARTVFTNSGVTPNTELVITDLDSALRAAIELHDLPPADPGVPPVNGGCPVPSGSSADICPTSPNNSQRSEARNVMARWRSLTPAQHQDVINFLKAL